MEILGGIVLIIYIAAAWKANSYLSYHLLHVEATYTNNLTNYYLKKIIFAFLFGFFTIPIAIIHKLVTKN